MNRKTILETAISVTCGDRETTHGDCQTNMQHTADMWSAYLGVCITAIDVAHMMVMGKISRVKSGNTAHADHFVDQCGYAAIAGQIATHETIIKSNN